MAVTNLIESTEFDPRRAAPEPKETSATGPLAQVLIELNPKPLDSGPRDLTDPGDEPRGRFGDTVTPPAKPQPTAADLERQRVLRERLAQGDSPQAGAVRKVR